MPKNAIPKITRRQAVLGAAAGFAAPMFVPRSVLGGDGKPGANDTINVATIGVGFRATLLMDQLPEGGQIVALSDCDLTRAEEFRYEELRKLATAKMAQEKPGQTLQATGLVHQ